MVGTLIMEANANTTTITNARGEAVSLMGYSASQSRPEFLLEVKPNERHDRKSN
jgi:hypothetical protein